MPDITGTTGANFTIALSAATIMGAFLEVGHQPKVPLTISGDGRQVTVSSLPNGDSIVRVDLVWAPGEDDAIIDVGTVTSGTVKAADPKHTLDAGITPGFIELKGTSA